MSDLARRTAFTVAFDGADITEDLAKYLISLTYVDKEEDESDELTIELHDRDGIWMREWLSKAVVAAATSAAGTVNEPEGEEYIVSSPTGVKTREEPTTNSKVTGSIPGGTKIVVSANVNGWAEVQINGTMQHLMSEHIMLAGVNENGNTFYAVPTGAAAKPAGLGLGAPIVNIKAEDPAGPASLQSAAVGKPAATVIVNGVVPNETAGASSDNGIMPMRLVQWLPGFVSDGSGGGSSGDGVGTPTTPPRVVNPTPQPTGGTTPQTPAKQTASGTLGPSTVLKIQATILPQYWGSDTPLECGQFELDNVKASGPEARISIKAVALPFTSTIRQTKKTKAWEGYNLSSIGSEIAGNAGMAIMYDASNNPTYTRAEQYKESDITFLSRLCHDAGLSLKCTNNSIVIFDQKDYEGKDEVLTIKYGDKSYTSYSFSIGTSDTEYQSCRVSYTDPVSGAVIEGIATVEDYGADKKNNQRLEITAKVSSAAEAKALAEKHLRLQNKLAKSCTFSMPGNTEMLAGCTVKLEGWGLWDGKYIIKQATHKIKNEYTTSITLRNVLEGY